jgi:hypothetical protein
MVASTLATEGDYLSDLIDEVADGRRTPAQARLAARRYAGRMNGTANAAFHEASPSTARFWWRTTAEESCADCPRLEQMSPWEKDELWTRPREGETECVSGCKCFLIREDGAVSPGPVSLGGYEEE